MGSLRGKHFRSALCAIESIGRAETFTNVCGAVSDLTASFGYNHICLLTSSSCKDQPFDERVVLKLWPKAWSEQYSLSNFYAFDPVAPRIRQRPESFTWAEIYPSTTEKIAKEIMAIATTDYGLKHGFCVPVHGMNGYQAGASMAGQEVESTHEARSAIELVTMFAFNRLTILRSRQPAAPMILTPREREVMTWVAAGKTAWATGEILKISEDTVNKMASTAMQKLDVHTRAQAVAECIRRGEIDL